MAAAAIGLIIFAFAYREHPTPAPVVSKRVVPQDEPTVAEKTENPTDRQSEAPVQPVPKTEPPVVQRPAPGKTTENKKDGLTYVWIPPGSFLMGCSPGDSECFDDEKPARLVLIASGFWIGQTEVTQAAYRRVVGTNPSDFKGDRLPVETITWDQAKAYCVAIGGRLPTEAEWEYAARGGVASARYGALGDIAWYSADSGSKTHDVGEKQPNGYGLFDTLGNVWEWTADWYEEGKTRSLRGGSWYAFPRLVRVSYRNRYGPGVRYNTFGVRCVRE